MRALLPRVAVLVPLLVLWELAFRGGGSAERYPHPIGVVEALIRRVGDGTLLTAIEQSLGRVLIAFAFAAVLGVALGIALGTSRAVDRALAPIVDALRSIAPIAWIPMAVLWLGITGNAAIFIVAYAAIFPIILSSAQAARSTDKSLTQAALTLGAGRLLVLRRIVFPSALPTIMVGARIAMGFAWASIIAAELAMAVKLDVGTTVKVGLGQLMINTLFVERDINGLVLYMIVIGVVALIIDQFMRRIRLALSPWVA